MKVRFQADADLNQIILQATVRRESSIDFQTAEAAGLAHLQDRDVLVMAAREGRMLVTHDQKHLTVAAVTEDLLLIWFTTEAEEWINRISFLPLC
jgi:predicted nuclease of predicted toxin-antitoxin system